MAFEATEKAFYLHLLFHSYSLKERESLFDTELETLASIYSAEGWGHIINNL
jgi:hypothetical protein